MAENNSVSIVSNGAVNNDEAPPYQQPQSINPSAAPPYAPNPQPFVASAAGPMLPQYMPPQFQNQYLQPPGGIYSHNAYQGLPHNGYHGPAQGIGAPPYGPQQMGLHPPRPMPRQQQQQQVVVIGAGSAPAPQYVPMAPSFATHYALACCVFWFAGFLFGLIAFILAAVGSSKARTDPKTARQYGSASIAVSVTGIIIAILAAIIALSVLASLGVFSSSGDGASMGTGYNTRYCYNSYGLRVSCSSLSY